MIYSYIPIQRLARNIRKSKLCRVCRIKSGEFLNRVGYKSFYGYVKFPVYEIVRSEGILGCFKRDKSGKEQEVDGILYLDHNLAMHIWDNQLIVKTIAMKNGKIGSLDSF